MPLNAYLPVVLLLTSCAAVPATESAPLATLAMPSTSLYDLYRTMVGASDASGLRAISVEKLYQDALATTTDTTVLIPDLGLSWPQLHTTLAAKGEVIAAMSAKMPTLGDLIDAQLLRVPAALGLSTFQAALRDTYPSDSALALVGGVPQPIQTQPNLWSCSKVPGVWTHSVGQTSMDTHPLYTTISDSKGAITKLRDDRNKIMFVQSPEADAKFTKAASGHWQLVEATNAAALSDIADYYWQHAQYTALAMPELEPPMGEDGPIHPSGDDCGGEGF